MVGPIQVTLNFKTIKQFPNNQLNDTKFMNYVTGAIFDRENEIVPNKLLEGKMDFLRSKDLFFSFRDNIIKRSFYFQLYSLKE